MPTEYVTQGTVQLKVSAAGTKAEVRISPAQGYSVERDKEEFIVSFARDKTSLGGGRLDVQVWKKDAEFEADGSLMAALIAAAAQGIKLEIGITDDKIITSVRMPATSK